LFSLWSGPVQHEEVFSLGSDPRLYNLVAVTHLLKLQCLQNRVLRAVGDFDRRTPVRDLHLAFKIPYVYDYVGKSISTLQMDIELKQTRVLGYIGYILAPCCVLFD
jgi:hypothetical protein